jgi:hypothetical protein
MFGMKKPQASKQRGYAARESERTITATKAAKLHEQRLAHEAGNKKRAARSPAEKTKRLSNSRAERTKNAPSV